jgi:hypothetical protein
MPKFGARISPHGGVDFDRITEQKSQYVEMTNAHVEQCEPLIRGKKRLPMRYCTHLDRSQNRRSQLVPLEELFENAHRLIEPHPKRIQHRNSAASQGCPILKLYTLAFLDKPTATPLKSSVWHSRGGRVGAAQYEDKEDGDRHPNDEIVRDATQKLSGA